MLCCVFQRLRKGSLQAPSALELTAEGIYTYFQKRSLRGGVPVNSTRSVRGRVSFSLSL